MFNEKFRLADMDLEVVALKAGTEAVGNSPPKNIIRYQMLEMILRIGAQKYFLRSMPSPSAITSCRQGEGLGVRGDHPLRRERHDAVPAKL